MTQPPSQESVYKAALYATSAAVNIARFLKEEERNVTNSLTWRVWTIVTVANTVVWLTLLTETVPWYVTIPVGLAVWMSAGYITGRLMDRVIAASVKRTWGRGVSDGKSLALAAMQVAREDAENEQG